MFINFTTMGLREVDHVLYTSPANTNILVFMADTLFYHLILTTSPDYSDVINSGITIRPYKPSEYHEWDDVNEEWVLNMGLWTAYLSERVSLHRDQDLEGTVEFTFDTTTFRLQKNVRTVSAITAYHSDIPVENDENYSVDYLTYTEPGEPELFVTLNGSQIQEIHNRLTKEMKNTFSAHKFIMVTTHGSTPYIPDFDNNETAEDCIQRALSDFDTHLSGL